MVRVFFIAWGIIAFVVFVAYLAFRAGASTGYIIRALDEGADVGDRVVFGTNDSFIAAGFWLERVFSLGTASIGDITLVDVCRKEEADE